MAGVFPPARARGYAQVWDGRGLAAVLHHHLDQPLLRQLHPLAVQHPQGAARISVRRFCAFLPLCCVGVPAFCFSGRCSLLPCFVVVGSPLASKLTGLNTARSVYFFIHRQKLLILFETLGKTSAAGSVSTPTKFLRAYLHPRPN